MWPQDLDEVDHDVKVTAAGGSAKAFGNELAYCYGDLKRGGALLLSTRMLFLTVQLLNNLAQHGLPANIS